MPEIDEIATTFDAADMGATDLLVYYSASAGAAGAVPASQFIAGHDLAVDGGDHDFGTSTIDDLTATSAEIGEATITTSMTINGGASVTGLLAGSAGVTPSDITAGSGETVTATLTGVTTAMFLSYAFTSILPDGLIAQAWISDTDEVSIRFHNSTGSTISSASYTIRMTAIAV